MAIALDSNLVFVKFIEPGRAAFVALLMLREFSFNLRCSNCQMTQSADRIVCVVRVQSVREVWPVLMDHGGTPSRTRIDGLSSVAITGNGVCSILSTLLLFLGTS
jgi:hypothetical protein